MQLVTHFPCVIRTFIQRRWFYLHTRIVHFRIVQFVFHNDLSFTSVHYKGSMQIRIVSSEVFTCIFSTLLHKFIQIMTVLSTIMLIVIFPVQNFSFIKKNPSIFTSILNFQYAMFLLFLQVARILLDCVSQIFLIKSDCFHHSWKKYRSFAL